MKYYCNPVNVSYRYQFNPVRGSKSDLKISREAADPSIIFFRGRYYIYASMTLGVWVSDDLVKWENHRLPDELPLYDYAPDARVIGEYVYICASAWDRKCDRWRTKDPVNGPYEKITGTFIFWDPNLFTDDDGRVYFYWGCSNAEPIYGVELDPVTMVPLGEKKALIFGDAHTIGYERFGEDNSIPPASEAEIEAKYREYVSERGLHEETLSASAKAQIRNRYRNTPYIEGAWMDKHGGKYYLQYACPGAEFNVYSDGVYVGESPLGPFRLAANNPYSYKPGGFLPGAGHGSTMRDREGNLWHTSTMRISVNHTYERRVGLWPAGFDRDGELFCNQRYGDWPVAAEGDPWRDPAWMLLSVHKAVTASSFTPGHEPAKAAEENVQTWWRAASNCCGEWLCLDLGREYDVHAVQINFADDGINVPCPGEIRVRGGVPTRYIDEADRTTRWKLEGSPDGRNWFLIEDKSEADTDLPHDLIVREEGFRARYLRLSEMSLPFAQNPCVSGLRVFGLGNGEKPAVPGYTAVRQGDLDMVVTIAQQRDTLGYNILFGSSPEKLYHSYMVFEAGTRRVGALIKGRDYYVRVDAFNESGITEGSCRKLSE